MLLFIGPLFIHILSKKARHDSSEDYYGQSKAAGLLSSETEELGGICYRPRTRETKATYEVLLSFIRQSIGDQVKYSYMYTDAKYNGLHVPG